MKIRLISTDQQLYQLCREILSGFPDSHWDLVAGAHEEEPATADLNIWDFDPTGHVPRSLDFSEEQKNIFLVQRKHLHSFRERLPLAAVGTLLKPVNQETLRTFLEHAVARYESHKAGKQLSPNGSWPVERDEMLQCLLHANLKLQEYDLDRTNFLARAVHDFRTPLTAINGYCGLLLGPQLGPLNTVQSDVLQRMQLSIRRLSRMATAMFQLSTGRQIEKRPNRQMADIEACVNQALHEIMPFAGTKNISVNLQWSQPAEPLYFEPAQIEQVLVNLLDNACKFTPVSGSIEVSGSPVFWERRALQIHEGKAHADRRNGSSRKSNAFRVQVRDSGPGFPAEQLDKIFEEYTSYSGGQDRSGAGLGLAICKMILTAHQGRVLAESNGQGATFSFLLPFSRESGAPIEPPSAAKASPAEVPLR